MKYGYLYSIYGLIMIAASLLGLVSIITGLANADIYPKTQKQFVVKAKKLDANNDGVITLDELTGCQTRRTQKLDCNEDGQIDNTKYNARLAAMFGRMDSNRDGMLDDNEFQN